MKKNSLFIKIMALLFCAALLLVPLRAAAQQDFLALLDAHEREYITQQNIITVVFSPDKGPIQYMDGNGAQKGISRDVLDEVARISGLRFAYQTIAGMQNIRASINSEQAQIVAGIPPEDVLKKAYDVEFSDPYIECAYGVILRRGKSLDAPEGLALALTAGLDVPARFSNVKAVHYYDTIAQCIDAVNRGDVDFTYGNSYVLEFYSQGYQYQSLCVVPLLNSRQSICFGVSHKADAAIGGILNKAIGFLGEEQLTQTMVKNVAASTQPITIASLISLRPRTSALFSALILLLVAGVGQLMLQSNRRKNRLLWVEHQRHLLLSEAAQEYFYEYNFKTDTLILAPDTAALFGVKQQLKKWNSRLRQAQSLEADEALLVNALYADCHRQDAQASSQSLELRLPMKDGEKRWFRITRLLLFEGDAPAYSIGKLLDVEQEHQERTALMQKSITDGLTGIYNAMAVREFVELAMKSLRSGVYFMMDLDYFKQVNDRFGHQTGNRVLKEFSKILQASFRADDIIGRVGGDEFAVLAKNNSSAQFIKAKCEQLQRQAATIALPEGHVLTLSIGVAVIDDAQNYDQLFQRADAALYYAKEHGRNGYRIFG